jgi:hypothetical protein
MHVTLESFTAAKPREPLIDTILCIKRLADEKLPLLGNKMSFAQQTKISTRKSKSRMSLQFSEGKYSQDSSFQTKPASQLHMLARFVFQNCPNRKPRKGGFPTCVSWTGETSLKLAMTHDENPW